MHEFDVTTIVFAALAIFVLFKLRSVLGTKTGNERPPSDPFKRRSEPPAANGEDGGNVVRLPGAAQPAPDVAAPAAPAKEVYTGLATEAAWPGLDEIRRADPSFEAKSFLDGAKTAYEMIVTAFAAGNRAMLSGLLAKDVFDSFAGEIAAREARGETVEMTFVSIEKATITDAHLKGGVAQISIDFVSKLITATREKSGVVVDGSPEKVVDVVDIWTFAREVRARDPNWKLVATGAPH
jgi:predicted lipid-binding transport protein (Tim44 family)